MKLKLYSIFDQKLEIYRYPLPAINKGHAIRNLESMIARDPELKKYKTDFTLFEVGEYDEQTGVAESAGKHERVIGLWELQTEDPAQLPLPGTTRNEMGLTQ